MDRLWHLAAQHVYKEILERIWVWDRKVQLTPEDELLLVKDEDSTNCLARSNMVGLHTHFRASVCLD